MHLAPGTGERPLGRRFVDDAKVTDHHAIIPTTVRAGELSPPDERKIYDLICRRLLSAWHDDHIWAVTTVITAIVNAGRHRPLSHHRNRRAAGRLEGARRRARAPPNDRRRRVDQPARPVSTRASRRTSSTSRPSKRRHAPPSASPKPPCSPPWRRPGKTLDEKELSDAMKETGLGTPATRAAIIEVLLKRGYIVREGKMLEATDKGIHLIEVVHPEVKSPAMTGQWEAYLKRIQTRRRRSLGPLSKASRTTFAKWSAKSADYTAASATRNVVLAQPPRQPATHRLTHSATPTDSVRLLQQSSASQSFRANQEASARRSSKAGTCCW